MTDFERKPHEPLIEANLEWEGGEGIVSVSFSRDHVRVETIHGSTSIYLSDLTKIYNAALKYVAAEIIIKEGAP